MSDERRDRLENIRLHQEERLRRDAASDAADRPDTEARVELARGDEGMVHAPTRAEIAIALWRGVLLAPLAAISMSPLARGMLGGLGVVRGSIMIGGTVGATAFLVDVVSKTRARHVEHVRVRVFQRHDPEPYVLAFLSLAVVIGAIVLAKL